jgi:peroxiredoxin
VARTDRRRAEEPEPARGVPPEVIAVFSREQQQLAAAGLPAGVAGPGTTLPDAELLDVHGSVRSLGRALGEGPAVVVLYRGVWCPYCNLALSTYQSELLPKLAERGVQLIAISPQTPDNSLSMQEKQSLGFTVLSDPGNTLARHLGVLTRPTDEAQEAQRRLGLDLTTVNADGTTGLPMPTTLAVGTDRTVRWIDVHPDYSTRTEPGTILTALDHLGW